MRGSVLRATDMIRWKICGPLKGPVMMYREMR